MKSNEAIDILTEVFDRYTQVPTKRIRKLVKPIVDENTMLKKDNDRLRKKVRRMRDGR